jgi:RimJ/RimL family protein N-acetyltransferase
LNGEPVTIEPIGLEHVEGYRRALDAVARERKYLTMLEAQSEADTLRFVESNLANGNPMMVALAGREVIGWCDVRREFFPSRAHRGTLGMGLLPEWRGQGVGRRLIEATLAQARRLGFIRIELDVYADNARAVALYERVGFVREGFMCDASLIDGVFRDTILMAIVEREAPHAERPAAADGSVAQRRLGRCPGAPQLVSLPRRT